MNGICNENILDFLELFKNIENDLEGLAFPTQQQSQLGIADKPTARWFNTTAIYILYFVCVSAVCMFTVEIDILFRRNKNGRSTFSQVCSDRGQIWWVCSL